MNNEILCCSECGSNDIHLSDTKMDISISIGDEIWCNHCKNYYIALYSSDCNTYEKDKNR